MTEARNGFSRLVADAGDGVNTHVLLGARVVAHIVPADAPIVDDQRLMNDMVVALAVAEAAAVAESEEWRDGCFRQPPENMGRMLAWAWRTDAALFDTGFSAFHAALSERGGRPIESGVVWEGLRPALLANLSDSEIVGMRAQVDRLST